MATPNVVPRADTEGGLGTSAKNWGKLKIKSSASLGEATATITNQDTDQLLMELVASNTTADVFKLTANSLTSANAMNVILNTSSTASLTNQALMLDLDKTGVTGSGQVYNGKAIIITCNDSATNHASGVSLMWGIQNTLTHSNATGTTKQYGLLQSLNGGDEQYGIKNTLTGGTAGTTYGLFQQVTDGGYDFYLQSSTDANDYFALQTGVNGETTITTVDAGATNAHLKFVIDGDMYIDPAGLDIFVGGDDNSIYTISKLPHSDGGGGGLEVQGGNATAGQTNDPGGILYLSSGQGTGSGVPGNITFRAANPGASGTSLNALSTIAKLGVAASGDNSSIFQMFEAGGASSVDYFTIEVFEHGSTKLSTIDTAAAAGHIEIEADGAITLDASAAITFEQGANSAALMECSGRVVVQQTFLKVMPDKFLPNGDSGRPVFVADNQTNKLGIHQYDGNDELYAHVEIPFGHTVTSVHVYASATVSSAVTIGAYNYNNGADNAVTTTNGDTNADISLGGNSIAGGAAQDLWIKVALGGSAVFLWGAKVTLTA